MRLLVLIFCLTFPSLHAAEAVIPLLESTRTVSEKRRELFRIKKTLEKATCASLIKMLESDKLELQLIHPLAQMLVRSGFGNEMVQTLCRKLQESKNDAGKSVELTSILADLRVCATSEHRGAFAESLIKLLNQTDVQAINNLLAVPNLPIDSRPAKFKDLLLNALKMNDLALQEKALSLLQETYPACILSEREIPTILKLAANQENSTAPAQARDLLSTITHLAFADSESWEKWWKANSFSFRIVDTAKRICTDDIQPLKHRLFALHQLNPVYRSEDELPNIVPIFIKIAENKNLDATLRKSALIMIRQLRLVESPVWKRKFAETAFSLLDKTELTTDIIEIFAYTDEANDPIIREKFLALMLDQKTLPLVRATAALTLAGTDARAEVGKHAVALLRYFQKLELDDDEPIDILVTCLEEIAGKSFGADADAWEREILGIPPPPGVLEPPTVTEKKGGRIRTRQPVRIDPNEVKFDIAKNERFKVIPFSLDSRRHSDFNSIPHSIIMGMYVVFQKNTNVVSSSGYVLQSVETESSELLKTDWQRTISNEMPVHRWETAESTLTLNTTNAWISAMVNLGSPSKSVTGFKHIKGYFSINVGAGEKAIKLDNPFEMIGKRLDYPELRASSIIIEKVDDRSIILTHTNRIAQLRTLKGLRILAEDNTPIDYQAKSEFGRDSVKVEISTAAPLSKKGKLIFLVFESVKDERVPFDLTNVRLEQTPVKPPKQPDF